MESNNYKFVHEKAGDQIWWVEAPITRDGEFLFSFDKVKVYNLFRDYPWELTPEEKEIFDRENPRWKEFFSDRQKRG